MVNDNTLADIGPWVGSILKHPTLAQIVSGTYSAERVAAARDVKIYKVSRPRQQVEALIVGRDVLVPREGTGELHRLRQLVGTLNDHLTALAAKGNGAFASLDESLSARPFKTIVRQAGIIRQKVAAMRSAGADNADLAALQAVAQDVVEHAKAVPADVVRKPGTIPAASEALGVTIDNLMAAVGNLSRQAKVLAGNPEFDENTEPEEYEAFFRKLSRIPVTRLSGTGLELVRDLASRATEQAKTVIRLWTRLGRLLDRLPPDDVLSLDDLRRHAEDGRDSAKRAWMALRQIATELEKPT